MPLEQAQRVICTWNQPALFAQPLIEIQVMQAAPPMSMTAYHHQHRLLWHAGTKTPNNLVKKTVEIQDTAGIFVATRIGRVVRIAVTPQKMLRHIERVKLREKEIPGFATKKFKRGGSLLR